MTTTPVPSHAVDFGDRLLRRMQRSGRLHCPDIFSCLSDCMKQKVLASRARVEKLRAARAKRAALTA